MRGTLLVEGTLDATETATSWSGTGRAGAEEVPQEVETKQTTESLVRTPLRERIERINKMVDNSPEKFPGLKKQN